MAKKEAASTKGNLPTYNVYVVEGDGKDRSYWTKVGGAWQHQDGDGFNISLTAVPLTGRLVIRTRKEKEVGE